MRFLSFISRSTALSAILLAVAPSMAALSIYMTPEELAERSTHIVEATVRNVASGEDPLTGALATYITLDVTRMLRGPEDDSRTAALVIRELGGAIDGRIHAIDAVPSYRRGERVIAFLQPAPDGALRTTGMFFGKYRLEDNRATRDLDGRGTIVGRPTGHLETVAARDLVAVATIPARTSRVALDRPAEMGRVRWADPAGDSVAKFGALSSSAPTRWQEGATGAPLMFDVERARNPLGDGTLAAAQIERALEAWTAIPESRIVVSPGNTNASFTPAQPSSPASVYPSSNIVLFGDPYDDITDPNPSSCSGVLAIGGYWRSSGGAGSANGISFYRALRGYVIFSNDFECFLGSPDNLAEVATHEIGHALGFGHSTQFDAVMRANAYGARGARLGDDDRDAAHCHYPHDLSLDSIHAGKTMAANDSLPIEWSTSVEAGVDPGFVTIQASFDGAAWETIVADTPNDGYYGWTLPERPSSDVRVRLIRPNLAGGWQSIYPAACTQSNTGAAFAIAVAQPSAGSVEDSLRLTRGNGDDLRLSWGASCSGDVDDHAVYSGELTALRSGTWSLSPETCSAGADLVEYLASGTGDRYFLVSPRASGIQGRLGTGTGRAARPVPPTICGPVDSSSTCP